LQAQLVLALPQLVLALPQLAVALSLPAMDLRKQPYPSYKYAPAQMATEPSAEPSLWLLPERVGVWHKYRFYGVAQSYLYPRCSGLILPNLCSLSLPCQHRKNKPYD
tara:strand:- start:3308 stop:3628 length:321 start_codon:yes stop_codon:yes gene_type:complete